MKFLHKAKDGGPESSVTGFWLAEIKSLFSAAVLKFHGRSREAYHTHAFSALSWVVRGRLLEHVMEGGEVVDIVEYLPSLIPLFTPRDRMHKVDSDGDTIVFTLRGPWCKEWWEYLENEDVFLKLAHGRRVVERARLTSEGIWTWEQP